MKMKGVWNNDSRLGAFMLKTFTIISFATIVGCRSLFSPWYDYPKPVPPDGYMLVDTYEGTRAYDWIRVENRMPDSIDVFVMAHDPRGKVWRKFALASIAAMKDLVLVPINGERLKTGRYYAVRVQWVNHKCISRSVRHNDLYLRVGDDCEECLKYDSGRIGMEKLEKKWIGASYADIVMNFGPGEDVEVANGGKILSYREEVLVSRGKIETSHYAAFNEHFGSGKASSNFVEVTQSDATTLWFLFDASGKVVKIGRNNRLSSGF